MQTLKATVHVSDQGIVQLSLPEHAGEELEVLLVYQPVAQESKRQWSEKFLQTFGGWQEDQSPTQNPKR
jgi:hypothetical protein